MSIKANEALEAIMSTLDGTEVEVDPIEAKTVVEPLLKVNANREASVELNNSETEVAKNSTYTVNEANASNTYTWNTSSSVTYGDGDTSVTQVTFPKSLTTYFNPTYQTVTGDSTYFSNRVVSIPCGVGSAISSDGSEGIYFAQYECYSTSSRSGSSYTYSFTSHCGVNTVANFNVSAVPYLYDDTNAYSVGNILGLTAAASGVYRYNGTSLGIASFNNVYATRHSTVQNTDFIGLANSDLCIVGQVAYGAASSYATQSNYPSNFNSLTTLGSYSHSNYTINITIFDPDTDTIETKTFTFEMLAGAPNFTVPSSQSSDQKYVLKGSGIFLHVNKTPSSIILGINVAVSAA